MTTPRVGRAFASRLVAAIMLVAALAVTGCGATVDAGSSARLHAQAQAALARWSAAVTAAGGRARVVPVGDLTGQVGGWEEAVGENNKLALMAGRIEAVTDLPTQPPPDGTLAWLDGSSLQVPLISAAHAVTAIAGTGSGPCGDCAPLEVTGALLTSGPIQTTRGPATSPLWELTLRGTAVTLTRVALADAVTVVPPTPNPADLPIGLAIGSASGAMSGQELTVTFGGVPDPGDKPCGADYTAEAVESPLAVVVIVAEHLHATLFSGCSSVGAVRTAVATLAAPLGDRAVLDVVDGLPVPVTLVP
jgi:uncharacterized protein YceK